MPRTSDRAGDAEILRLVPLVRRVLANRIRDPASVDDLVQETLVRVLEARQQLEQDALAPYAVATARNLAASLARAEQRSRRHAPRLLDPSVPERPDEAALRRQEAEAVKAALAGLSARDRDMLVAHEVEGVDTATLAHAQSTTPGSVAVRLARARATLRVDWLVAFRGVRLPTERCRPVLTALSAGDRRRQRALDAAGHLQTCPTCAELSGPLLERRRSLALLVPLVGLWWLLKRLWQWARRARVWVQFSDRGESPRRILPASRVSFTGRMVANRPGFARRVGVTDGEGGGTLDRQGAHVEVDSSRVRLR